ncbi:uncharacterized protein LOC142661641 [Rhinoderma darwinii]|uniref:uncharacterized protein LOC142661641 n=1 Tax=Rhinoderma darwinii TaxID=43563 RepID=UPI003F668BFE
MNLSDIVCKAKVQDQQNVQLIWELPGHAYYEMVSRVIPVSDNSYWIISILNHLLCQSEQNMTLTCQLQYMKQSLVNQSIEATCAGGGRCAVTLLQPQAVAAMPGSSVNLSCVMQLNGENVHRTNLYWLIPGVNNKVKEYLHPRPERGTTRSKNSRLIYPMFTNDLSLTIDDVQLSYTDTYVCEASLLILPQNTKTTGRGTYLLVYEEFRTFMNLSDIVCKAKVQDQQNVQLIWELPGHAYYEMVSRVIPVSDNSYWIISILNHLLCQSEQNMTLTCQLQYMKQSLVNQSIEATCAGGMQESHSPLEPVLLYALILGNSLLILIIIIIFWVKKNKTNRRTRVIAPNAKFGTTSRMKYNG